MTCCRDARLTFRSGRVEESNENADLKVGATKTDGTKRECL